MRLSALVVCASLAATSMADRLFEIPTAGKIPYESFRYDVMAQPRSNGAVLSFIDAGIGKSFEAHVRTIGNFGGPTMGALDVNYNLISPITDISPGIAFGVQDLFNRTPDGQRFFFAVSFRSTNTTSNGDYPSEVTMGAFVGAHSSGFLGFSIPLRRELLIIAEHDGYRLTAGLEYRPANDLSFRFISRGSQDLIGIQLSSHF